uniref:UspA domain-containing protein n=1 Tax=Cucumis sativus TaxID=3659 RepID=A0A0A0KMR5_CUCSA
MENSKNAANNLLKDGDHLILIHVQPPNSDTPTKLLFQDTSSPLIPLEQFREIKLEKQYGLSNDAEVLDILHNLATTKGVKVMAKVYWVIQERSCAKLLMILIFTHLFLEAEGIAWECEQPCGEKCFMSSNSGEREAIGTVKLQILIVKSSICPFLLHLFIIYYT